MNGYLVSKMHIGMADGVSMRKVKYGWFTIPNVVGGLALQFSQAHLTPPIFTSGFTFVIRAPITPQLGNSHEFVRWSLS